LAYKIKREEDCIVTRAFLNDPGGVQPPGRKKAAGWKKPAGRPLPPLKGQGWPRPKFPNGKIIGTTKKTAPAAQKKRIFLLRHLTYASLLLKFGWENENNK